MYILKIFFLVCDILLISANNIFILTFYFEITYKKDTKIILRVLYILHQASSSINILYTHRRVSFEKQEFNFDEI